MWWYTVQLAFLLFAPIYLIISSDQLIKLSPIFPAFSDSNNASSFNITESMDLEEFFENQSIICEISSKQNRMNTLFVRNTANFTEETLNNDELKNMTNLVKIISLFTPINIGKSNNLASELDATVTNSNSSIALKNGNSTLIRSSNVEINNSLILELVTLQNVTQNDTAESINIPNPKDIAIKMIPLAISKTIKELNSEFEANVSSADLNNLTYMNHIHTLSETKSNTSQIIPMKNAENVIFISNSLSVKSDFRRFLEKIRNASDALLQSFPITMPSSNVTVFDNNDKILMEINNSSAIDSRNFHSKQWIYFIMTNSCYIVASSSNNGQNSTSNDNDFIICSTQDAFLTSITDSNEMEFILGLVGNDAYLIDLFEEKYNHTELDYTKLASNTTK
uniref:Uncharacterized protein n=1 Tax=Onchocerca volvulus TaxID=6282 RepID=A0A8R1XTC2_ONCVO